MTHLAYIVSTEWPKSKPLLNHQQILLNRIKNLQ